MNAFSEICALNQVRYMNPNNLQLALSIPFIAPVS